MSEERPLVSVIVPVYNGARYLSAALGSILRQSYRPLEVIVVDDGSTDESSRIAKEIGAQAGDVRLVYLYQVNQGPGAARNTGLGAAQGELIAFLDSDDEWLPGKLTQQVAAALHAQEAGCVICHLRVTLEPGAVWPRDRNEAYYAQDPPAYIPSALLAHRWVFDRVGGFDASYRVGEDTDWFFRAQDAGVAVTVVPEVLLLRRLRTGSLSNTAKAGNSEMMRLLRASVTRKRKDQVSE